MVKSDESSGVGMRHDSEIPECKWTCLGDGLYRAACCDHVSSFINLQTDLGTWAKDMIQFCPVCRGRIK